MNREMTEISSSPTTTAVVNVVTRREEDDDDVVGASTAGAAAPAAKKSGPPPITDQIKEILFGSKLNIFYLCIPVCLLSGTNDGPGALTFTSSFFALIPLAALLGDLTEDLADQTNDAIGALINVTFGNITEVIVGFAALRLRQYDLIQMTMLGSVFGNMLLVLGSSLVVAGLRTPILSFNGDAVKTYVGLLLLGCMGTVIPTAFWTLSKESGDAAAVRTVSGHISLVMIVFYALYLFFQLRTHKSMFDGVESGEGGGADDDADGEGGDDDDDDDGPKFSFLVAFIAIGAVALLISLISDFLVDTVSAAADTFHLSRHFIGLVIIPIVGNVAEHASAIMMAAKGKMDIAFGVALGSSIQIQMFALPLLMVGSWVLGLEMDLNVTPFLAATLLVSVIVTYACVFDSSATWLQGAKLLCVYLLLALAFLDAPDPTGATGVSPPPPAAAASA